MYHQHLLMPKFQVLRAFVLLLASIPFGVASFLAPLVCFGWLLFTGPWSPMLFIFFTDCRAKFGDAYSIQFMLASMALASIPTATLGKGFENQPGIMVIRGMLSLSFVLSAWLLSCGCVSSYWHVLGIHAAALPVGFLIGFFVEGGNEG